MQPRQLGNTHLKVTPVAMGCWPISGITSLDVNPVDSLATLRAAADSGINFFDTAHSYGTSELLLAEALGERRHDVVIASKGGLTRRDGRQIHDARPESLRQQCHNSLQQLNRRQIDLYYLHAVDPAVPIEESAGAIAELITDGCVAFAGASNLSLAELQRFHAICPLTAVQPPYNLLQRGIEADLVPWCCERQISICIYWPLLKGLLAGLLPRNHIFSPGDGRAKYPMFQGTEWERNQDLLDDLRPIASELNVSLATLSVAWTIHQPGITSALCGAKRDWQIQESAAAAVLQIPPDALSDIHAALLKRGPANTRAAV
ncbi:MAG: ral stress protein 69 [Planctomycetota bacterium]|jgi:aryl-alcohol dehydrogenase-like predicted oxidoreductase